MHAILRERKEGRKKGREGGAMKQMDGCSLDTCESSTTAVFSCK